jgi:hypothetical protein
MHPSTRIASSASNALLYGNGEPPSTLGLRQVFSRRSRVGSVESPHRLAPSRLATSDRLPRTNPGLCIEISHTYALSRWIALASSVSLWAKQRQASNALSQYAKQSGERLCACGSDFGVGQRIVAAQAREGLVQNPLLANFMSFDA